MFIFINIKQLLFKLNTNKRMDIHINRPRQKTQNSQLYEKLLQDQYQISQPFEEKASLNEHEVVEQKVQMIIDLGNNNNSSILVGKHDDPDILAKRFCFKYNVDPRIISTLANNIKKLQMANFTHTQKDSTYKIQRNQSFFDDKQNFNSTNHIQKEKKGHKRNDSNKSRMSRTKTGYSNYNDSGIISTGNSRVNQNNSNSNRYNVFQRLYQDSRKKQVYREIQESTNKKTNRMSLNTSNNINKSLNESSVQICLNIYDKNTKLRQSTIKHNEHLNQAKKQKQVQQCQFKPKINSLSNIIATKLREMDQSKITHDSNNKQLTKIKEYLIKKEEQEMKECTFKPKIISKMSNEAALTCNERYLQLHDDFLVREAKKKKISQEKNKNIQKENQPSINKLSQALIKKDFFERLQQNKQKRMTKMQSQQRQKSKSHEKRPSTGRAPINRNLGQKTIGQYLYQKSKNSRALTTKQPPKILADPKSLQIYSDSKHLAFEYIFQLLDNDQDGLISSTKINISGFGPQMLRLLAPLLSEMEEVNVQLNEQEFIQAFDRLFQTFSVAEKNYVLKFYKNKNSNNNSKLQMHSFHPNLNEKSLIIARQLCEGQGDIYESSISRMKEKEEKLNRKRAERMLEQYSECTFHPRINF